PGNLIDLLRGDGLVVETLPISDTEPPADLEARDATETIAALGTVRPAWLIVDHYELSDRWEAALRSKTEHLFVIDDVLDRRHLCDFFLDQNFSFSHAGLEARAPPGTQMLLGPHYALLGAPYSQNRTFRDATERVRRVLIY